MIKNQYIFLFFIGLTLQVSLCQDLPSYFTFKPSGIFCPKNSSNCTKFLLSEVNSKTNVNIEVKNLYFESSVNQSIVLSAGANNVVIKGFFMTVMGPIINFRVQQAYRLVPTPNAPPAEGKFYQIENSGIMCIPERQCPGKRAVLINGKNTSVLINNFDDSAYNSIFLFDMSWLESKIVAEKPYTAIVYGTANKGNLVIHSAYVNINDPPTKCPELPLAKCLAGHVTTYIRGSDRCYSFDECTKSGLCSLAIPKCSDHFRLVSYPSKSSHGCPKYLCEPDFLPPTSFHNE
ncbi:hypothetical protein PPL_05670 [Heterostelium album PN500]|uniref:Uncharacterized protein n=1 Tax=Heterostelium pallidum (strain ATCC 26659 / Pp 5 / PN500) TaxID=670386 RepID=D3BAT9_HETP5|nr:hypothetical protein PPL_05670 [Heterostelium album PN500]EFA81676.1 hypothetical protein PPL_05670 [Heterostelium album PN500]|eukprot:XP_020433793.1 hypothetical protein PPL_05670 [Heterostelium album PN500]